MRRDFEMQSNAKLNKLKTNLLKSQQQLEDETAQWEERLDKLERDLARASDKTYMVKRKSRDAMQKHLDEAKCKSVLPSLSMLVSLT